MLHLQCVVFTVPGIYINALNAFQVMMMTEPKQLVWINIQPPVQACSHTLPGAARCFQVQGIVAGGGRVEMIMRIVSSD